jgi:hypothetical protein
MAARRIRMNKSDLIKELAFIVYFLRALCCIIAAELPALPAAGERKAGKRETAKVQENLDKTRGVPAVRCTPC